MENNKKKKEILKKLSKSNQIKPKDKEDQLSVLEKQENKIKTIKKEIFENLINIGFIPDYDLPK